MTNAEKTERLKTVRTNLEQIMIGTIATVNGDGTPHASPVFVAFTNTFDVVWSSNPSAQHSRNIQRDPSVFITIFDSVQARGGGLYIAGHARELNPTNPDFASAYRVFADRKGRFGDAVLDIEAYSALGGQRLYVATDVNFWINYSQKDTQGAVMHDERCSVTLDELKGEA